MKGKLKRALSCILVVAMLIQMAPFQVFATEEDPILDAFIHEIGDIPTNEDGTPAEIINDGRAGDVYIQGEVEALRDEYEKHFRLTDGSFIAAQYQVPVHYEEAGQWVDIDNTLELVTMYDGTEVYQAVNGDNVQAFAGTLADGTVMSLNRGDTSITMKLWDGEIASEEIILEEPETVPEESMEPEVPDETTDEESSAEPAMESELTETGDESTEIETTTNETLEPVEETTEPETEEASAVPEEPEMVTEEPAETADTNVYPSFNREVVAQVVAADAELLTAVETEEDELWEITDVIPETLSSAVLYEDVYPNVDIRYDTFSCNVKESIILNAPVNVATEIDVSGEATESVTPYTYTFLLELTDLTPALQEDGSILLLGSDDEIRYTIPAPYMEDSTGLISTEVYYELEEIDAGWLLTIHADAAWLENEERLYPVTIDPTILEKVSSQNFMVLLPTPLHLQPGTWLTIR